MRKSLDFIYDTQRDLSILSGIIALLDWDQKTYMPPGGVEERANKISLISRITHEKFTSEELFNHVKKLADSDNIKKLGEKQQIVVKRLEKDIEKARKIPSDFIQELSKTTSRAYTAWETAKEKNKFNIFAPHLEKIVMLKKKYTRIMDLPGHPYNSLLDDYDEGMTVEKLQRAFRYLKPRLIEILNTVSSSDAYKKQHRFRIIFEGEKQKKICHFLFKKMCMPDDKSRLDISIHPYNVVIGNNDIRITTNFGRKDQPLYAFFSTIHEVGHALYELGLPQGEYKDTVISDTASVGLHESQSLFWTDLIAHNINFWKYFYPVFRRTFEDQLRDIDFETWYSYVNQIKPSWSRMGSDELTYSLHILLRFELELDLIDGAIGIAELPALWNEKMKELLGIIPKSDAEGILQDMHWSVGYLGFFPTYAVGKIYSTQLYSQLVKELPAIDSEIERGAFKNIISWLRENVYKYGRIMTSEEIIKNTCHEGLNPRVFIQYLKNKYYNLYNIGEL